MELVNAAYQFARANKVQALDALINRRLPAWMREAYYSGLNADVLPAQSRQHYSNAVCFYSSQTKELKAA
jgi:hypothetical protein